MRRLQVAGRRPRNRPLCGRVELEEERNEMVKEQGKYETSCSQFTVDFNTEWQSVPDLKAANGPVATTIEGAQQISDGRMGTDFRAARRAVMVGSELQLGDDDRRGFELRIAITDDEVLDSAEDHVLDHGHQSHAGWSDAESGSRLKCGHVRSCGLRPGYWPSVHPIACIRLSLAWSADPISRSCGDYPSGCAEL